MFSESLTTPHQPRRWAVMMMVPMRLEIHCESAE